MSHLTRPECHIVANLQKHSFSMNWIEGIMPLQLSSHIQSISWSVNQWPSWTVSRVASATKKSGILHNITFKILSMSHHCVTRVSHRLTDSYRRCFLFSLYLILLKMLGLLLLFAIMLNQLLMLGLALRLEPGRSNPRRLFRNSGLWRRLKSNNFCLEFHFLDAEAYFDWVNVI